MHQSYLDFSPFASIRAFFAQFECAPLSSIKRRGVLQGTFFLFHFSFSLDPAIRAPRNACAQVAFLAHRRRALAKGSGKETRDVCTPDGQMVVRMTLMP
jgi:hypothetical protein